MLEELLIKIKSIFEGGGFDSLTNKLRSAENQSKSSSSNIKNDLNKINDVDWSKVSSKHKQLIDQILSQSKTGADSSKNEFEKINGVDFSKLGTTFKTISDKIATDASITADVSIAKLQEIANNPDFSNLSVRFKSGADGISSDATITANIATTELQKINQADFKNLSVHFKTATEQMAVDSKAATSSIMSDLQSLDTGLGGMLTGAGATLGMDKLFNEAYSRASMMWRLNNQNSAEASQILKAYTDYDISSARPDHDLVKMMEWIINSGEIRASNTKQSLSILDAISANADPIRERGAMFAYGRYLGSGYEAAKMAFRDEGLSESQLEMLSKAKTYEERLQALKQLGIERGTITIGQNGEIIGQYNTMEGEIGGYNQALALLDIIVQAATLSFMQLMNWLKPIFEWLSSITQGNQKLIGSFIIGIGILGMFTGGLAVLSAVGNGAVGFVRLLTGGLGFLNNMLKGTAIQTKILIPLMEKLGISIKKAETSTGGGSSKSSGPGFLERMGNMGKKGFITNLKGIAVTMTLAAAAIVMLIIPLMAIAALGLVYKAMEAQVKKGAEAIIIVGGITAIVLAAIGIFQGAIFGAGKLFIGSGGAAILPMIAGIAFFILSASAAILLLNVPLLAIAALGAVFSGVEKQARKGIEIIKLVANTLVEISPALLLFAVAVALFALIPLSGIYAVAGIAITIVLTTEAIILLEVPLKKVAELGGKFNDLKGVEKGITAIKSALTAIILISQIYTEANKVKNNNNTVFTGGGLSDIIALIMNIADDKNSLDQLINIISDLEDFINKYNTITEDLPQIKNPNALKNVLSVISDVNNVINGINTGLKGTNSIDWETNWNNYNGGSGGPFDKLGNIILGVSNFIKNISGKVTSIPKIDSKKLEGLKSSSTVITEISTISTNMSQAIKNINNMQGDNNWNNFNGGKGGPFNKVGNIVEGVINFMKHNKDKLNGLDTESMKKQGVKFRQLTSGFNYFLNDTINTSSRFTNLKDLKTPEDSDYFKVEKFATQIINRLGNLKKKMDNVKTDDYSNMGLNFRKITSQYGYFINDTINTSNRLQNLSKIKEPDWSQFARIEKMTGRVMTSINSLKSKISGVEDVGTIGATWRNSANQFMYFVNDYNRINQAMAVIGDEPIPYEKLSKLEITIGRILTSLKTITNKVNGSGMGEANSSNITSVVNSIVNVINQINTALNAAAGVDSSSRNLGAKIPTGIKAGMGTGGAIGSWIVSSITTSINSKNSYFLSSGKRLATSLVNGFRSSAIQLKTVAASEVNWALNAITSRASSFWTAGAKLGAAMKGGYEDASGGLAGGGLAGGDYSSLSGGEDYSGLAGGSSINTTNSTNKKIVTNNISIKIDVGSVRDDDDLVRIENSLESIIDKKLRTT